MKTKIKLLPPTPAPIVQSSEEKITGKRKLGTVEPDYKKRKYEQEQQEDEEEDDEMEMNEEIVKPKKKPQKKKKKQKKKVIEEEEDEESSSNSSNNDDENAGGESGDGDDGNDDGDDDNEKDDGTKLATQENDYADDVLQYYSKRSITPAAVEKKPTKKVIENKIIDLADEDDDIKKNETKNQPQYSTSKVHLEQQHYPQPEIYEKSIHQQMIQIENDYCQTVLEQLKIFFFFF